MPAAWEILAARRKRVLLCIITPPDMRVTVAWAKGMRELILPTPDSTLGTIAGLPYGPARNQGLKMALDDDFAYLAFLDADTLPPKDWVIQLQATQRDLIGCMYYRRYPPFDPAHANSAVNDQGEYVRAPLQPHQTGEIIPADCLATGALLISARCMKAVQDKYPRPFEWGIDIARVPGDDGLLPNVSEDYIYSLRAKELGFQPWVHTGIEAGHETTALVTDKGLVMR